MPNTNISNLLLCIVSGQIHDSNIFDDRFIIGEIEFLTANPPGIRCVDAVNSDLPSVPDLLEFQRTLGCNSISGEVRRPVPAPKITTRFFPYGEWLVVECTVPPLATCEWLIAPGYLHQLVSGSLEVPGHS